jgi:hypothetical protein
MMKLAHMTVAACCLVPLAAQNALWRPRSNPQLLDLRHGPGADELEPDPKAKYDWVRVSKSSITARVLADDRGRSWYFKSGKGAKAEVAASRILWGLGFDGEPTFFLSAISVGGQNISDVCLRLRAPNRSPKGHWDWKANPFTGSIELDGLRSTLILLAASDFNVKNNVIWAETPSGNRIYAVWNLEQSLGRSQTFGHSVANPDDFAGSDWLREYRDDQIIFRNGFKVKASAAKWILERFSALKDEQIEDAFASAGFSPTESESYRNSLRKRLSSLESLLRGRLGTLSVK